VALSGGGHNRWCCVEAGHRWRRAAAAGSGATVEVAEGKQLRETRELLNQKVLKI